MFQTGCVAADVAVLDSWVAHLSTSAALRRSALSQRVRTVLAERAAMNIELRQLLLTDRDSSRINPFPLDVD